VSVPDQTSEAAPATDLTDVYARRFPDKEAATRRRVWAEIGRHLQRYIPDGSRVLDIGSDAGYFVASVRAREKVATDLRDMAALMPPDVRFVRGSSLKLRSLLEPGYFDIVLLSNFLEHLGSGDEVMEQLRVAYDLLAPGGRVIILQPNIRLIGGAYWHFIDHKTPLTERSLMEAAELAGFQHYKVVVRFLPYTTRSHLPRARLLVRTYLAFPPAWLLLGKQTLYVGEKPTTLTSESAEHRERTALQEYFRNPRQP
jgi:SAM-dependent methyltransferase